MRQYLQCRTVERVSCTAKREQMRDRIKTYVGVLRDNTAIVASVALFFLWLGITFQVPDFAVDGTFEPGLVAPWIVVAFCYALGYLVAVLWYRKIASLFLRRRFLVLVCLVMAAGVTIDLSLIHI